MLAFPLTYMNDSGQAVRSLVRRYGIDDPASSSSSTTSSTCRRPSCGSRPAAGWPATTACAASRRTSARTDFVRVRIGVGKPPSKERGADHVLRPAARRAQRELFDVAVQEAADAVELIVAEGPDAAMRRFNVRATTGDG